MQLQVELASLTHEASRLVRVTAKGGRGGLGEGGSTQIVSARQRGVSGAGFIGGSGESELRVMRSRILKRKRQVQVLVHAQPIKRRLRAMT